MSNFSKAFGLIEEGFTALRAALEGAVASANQPDTSEPEAKPKNGRRRRKKADSKTKDAPPAGPNIENARKALLEVVNAFDDGNDAVEEILGEVEEGVKKISEINPKNYQRVIDVAAQYLKDCEEDDD